MQHFIGEHEAAIEYDSPTLIQMGMYDARTKAVTQWQDEHGPFII